MPDAPGSFPAVSVVIPVYNSAPMLRELVRRLEAVFMSRGTPFEVLLVDDGSRDASWQTISALAAELAFVRGLRLMRNYGQHNALLCGVRAATAPVIVTMDDDLQHPPEEVPRLLAKLEEGHDVVYGTPIQERHGLYRDVASRLTKLALESAMGVPAARDVSAFRAFRTVLRNGFAETRSPSLSLDVLLSWSATRYAAVPVDHRPRQQGRSNYTVARLVAHAFNMMTGYSALPLHLASFVGFFFTLFGMGVLAFVIGRYLLEGSVVHGFAFLASIIAIFSGAQLFALGVLGQYLGRVHFRSMERPAYVVSEETGSGDARA